MKIYPKRKKLFRAVTIIWAIVFILNSIFGLYFMKDPNINFEFFISLISLIFFKAVFNATYNYPAALKGELVFGSRIADAIFIFRQFFKTRS